MGAAKKGFMEMREAEYGQQDEALDSESGMSLELISYGGIKNATKTDIGRSAEMVISEANIGNIDALECLIICNKLEKFTEAVKEGVKKLAYEQTKIADGEIYKRLNVSVERGVFGIRWNFKNTNDPIWNNLEAQRIDRENYLKTLVLPNQIMDEAKRAEYIKSITVDEVVDEETGEVVQEKCQLNPPTKTGSAGLKITIEK